MSDILCITLNPTLDLSNEVDRIVPTHKVRVRNQRQDVGGGGINVARWLRNWAGLRMRWFFRAAQAVLFWRRG